MRAGRGRGAGAGAEGARGRCFFGRIDRVQRTANVRLVTHASAGSAIRQPERSLRPWWLLDLGAVVSRVGLAKYKLGIA